jgi:hypothetical protein
VGRVTRAVAKRQPTVARSLHRVPLKSDQGIELVERCVPHLGADEHDLGMRLISNLWTLHLLISDSIGVITDRRRLRESQTELHQVYGLLIHAIQLIIADRPEGHSLLEQAFEIQLKLPPGLDKTQAAVMCETFAGMAATQRGAPARAIGHAAEAGTHQDKLGFESELSILRWMTTAIGAAMTDDPQTALRVADDYAAADSPFATGDEIRAIAYLEMGDLDRARGAAHAHAKVAVTGRVPQLATDSLLLTAALANAEGDLATAKRLIGNFGICRHSELHGYVLQLAAELGVEAEYRATRVRLITGDGVRGRSAEDVETLRQEMTRRDWQ